MYRPAQQMAVNYNYAEASAQSRQRRYYSIVVTRAEPYFLRFNQRVFILLFGCAPCGYPTKNLQRAANAISLYQWKFPMVIMSVTATISVNEETHKMPTGKKKLQIMEKSRYCALHCWTVRSTNYGTLKNSTGGGGE
jgi:hypothetical protein